MIVLCGNKIGMSQVFDESGALIPVTLLNISSNVVVRKNTGKDGKSSVLAAGLANAKHTSKAHVGQFKSKTDLKKRLFETAGFEDKNIGDKLGIELFEDVFFVDVIGTSKGKGFQGVMKRHGMHGGPARHGSKFHRSVGAVGQGGTPAKFRKGSKMPGRMGSAKRTVQNLRVINVDVENKILTVRGAVPGPRGSEVFIRKALKKQF